MEHFIKYVNEICLRKFSEDDFLQLFSTACDTLKQAQKNVLTDEQQINDLFLLDTPVDQMERAIYQQCETRYGHEGAHRMLEAFLFRWYALKEARNSGWLQELTQQKPKNRKHPNKTGIVKAAATASMKDGAFIKESFLNLVRQNTTNE